MKPVFMTYTKKDLINLAVCMVLSVLIIPTFITTEYWYTSILIPWLCLALATIGQQVVMGYTGQLALGAAGFMAAGAFAKFNLILRVPDLGFVGSLSVRFDCCSFWNFVWSTKFKSKRNLSDGGNTSLTVFYYMDDR